MTQHMMITYNVQGDISVVEMMCAPRASITTVRVDKGQTRIVCPICQKALSVDVDAQTVQPMYYGDSPV